MSGGSLDYISFKIEDTLVGNMHDAELDELMKDVSHLVYTLEWWTSGDKNEEEYRDEVVKFKNKWFNAGRADRLQRYIDEKIDETRKEIYMLIGVKKDEPTNR